MRKFWKCFFSSCWKFPEKDSRAILVKARVLFEMLLIPVFLPFLMNAQTPVEKASYEETWQDILQLYRKGDFRAVYAKLEVLEKSAAGRRPSESRQIRDLRDSVWLAIEKDQEVFGLLQRVRELEEMGKYNLALGVAHYACQLTQNGNSYALEKRRELLARPEAWVSAKFEGHVSGVHSVAFSPDGMLVVTGSGDHTAKVWTKRGEQLRTLRGHTKLVSSVAFSPDGKYILTGSWDGTAKLWSVEGEELRTYPGHSKEVTSVAFSPDGRYVVTRNEDDKAKLWTIEGAEMQSFSGNTEEVRSVAFSPDGKYILTGNEDNTAKLWTTKGEEVKTFSGHTDIVYSVAFSPDGKYILTGSRDKTARLWEIEGEEMRTFSGHLSEVSSVAFSPDCRFVLTGSWDGEVKLWTLEGMEFRAFTANGSPVTSAAFSPDGRYVLTGSRYKMNLRAIGGTDLQAFLGQWEKIWSFAFSPDGKYILTGSEDKTAKLWLLPKEEFEQNPEEIAPQILSVAFTPVMVSIDSLERESHFILTGNVDNKARLWTTKGEEVKIYTGHTDIVNSVAFSPNGRYVLTGSRDHTARLWTTQGAELRTFTGHSDEITSVAFSPDGQHVLTGSGDHTARLWTTNGEELLTFTGHSDGVSCVAFSPDGKYVLTGSWDKTVKLWTIEGEELKTFTGHKSGVSSIAFSPDGQYILSGSLDGTARLWTLEGKERRTFGNQESPVCSVAFSPDGQYVLTGEWGRTAHLWALEGMESNIGAEQFELPGFFWSLCFSNADTNDIVITSYRPYFTSNHVRQLEKRTGLAPLTAAEKINMRLMGKNDCFQSSDPAEIVESAKYFLGEGVVFFWKSINVRYDQMKDALMLAQKADSLAPNGEAKVVLEDIHYYMGLDSLLTLKMAEEKRKEDSIRVAERLQNDKSLYADRYISALIQVSNWEEKVKENPEDGGAKNRLGREYGNLAWCSLFVGKSSQCVEFAQKGLELAPCQTWIITNLALGYLYTGDWKNARNTYAEWMDKPWLESVGSTKQKTFRPFFLDDLAALERAGVTHRKIKKVRVLLQG